MNERFIDQRTLKEKLKDKAEMAKRGLSNAYEWCKANKEIAILCGAFLLKNATSIYVEHGRRVRANKMQKLKDCRIYDRQHDMWLELRRPMEPWEKSIYIQRHSMDREPAIDVLKDLGLLKK